ncbi:MAG TPA: hypothetical protein V6D19_10905 [Stenomitos sp.]
MAQLTHPTTQNLSEVIQAIASDTAHEMLGFLMPSLSPPTDLPSETLEALCDGFKADTERLLQARLSWFVQSVQAEANELRRLQQLEAAEAERQAKLEQQQQVVSVPKPTPKRSAIPIISSGRASEPEPIPTSPRRLRRRSVAESMSI